MFAATIASRSVHTPSAPFAASEMLVTVIVDAALASDSSAEQKPNASAQPLARNEV